MYGICKVFSSISVAWKAQKAEHLCVRSNLARKCILTVSSRFCNHTPGLKIQHEGCIDQICINLLDPDFPIFDFGSQIAWMDPLGLSIGYWIHLQVLASD